jgi:hypothetical protein
MLTAGHCGHCRLPPYDTIHYIGLALLTSCLGIFGDAIESLIKRVGNVKDSGVFFPGHGGILDRFDAFFVSGMYPPCRLPLPLPSPSDRRWLHSTPSRARSSSVAGPFIYHYLIHVVGAGH